MRTFVIEPPKVITATRRLIFVAALAVSLTLWHQTVVETYAARLARLVAEAESRNAERQTELARAAEGRAERRFKQVRDLAQVFIYQLDPKLANLSGSAPLRQFVVKKGMQYLDALAAEAGDDLRLQSYLGGAYLTIGDVQGDLVTFNPGDLESAVTSYRKGVAILEQVLVERPNDLPASRAAMLGKLKIGDTLAGLGDQQGALDAYLMALDLGRRLAADHPDDAIVQDHVGAAHGRISGALQVLGDLEGAREHIRQSTRSQQEKIAADPQYPWPVQALAVLGALGTEDPDNELLQTGIGETTIKVGDSQRAMGERDAARAAFEHAPAVQIEFWHSALDRFTIARSVLEDMRDREIMTSEEAEALAEVTAQIDACTSAIAALCATED